VGAPKETHFEHRFSEPAITNVEEFLAGLRFEHRDKLAELPLDLVGGVLK